MNRNLSLACFMLVAVLIANPWAVAQAQQAQQPERIAISDMKKKLDSGEKLLLKQEGAIAGAIHIPVAELDQRMKDIPKDVQLVFY